VAVLLTYICCLHNSEVNKDLLLCKPLPTVTTGDELLNITGNVFNENEISW
jgi:hypothetical protein